MKKKVLVGLLLLIAIGTSAVFAQSQGKYYLEIYNISQAAYDNLERLNKDPATMREDNYFFVRTASGTTLRSKDRNLTLEEVKQKFLSISRDNKMNRMVNDSIPTAQQSWGLDGWGFNTGTPQYRLYFWLRRTE